MARDCILMTPTRNIVEIKFQDTQKKVLEGKGRKGKFHDFSMCNRKTKPLALGQWVFKTHDR